MPRIREAAPETRVLMLTMYEDEEYLREALRSGAAGYVLKRAAAGELLSAIRTVYHGGVYWSVNRNFVGLPVLHMGSSDPQI